MGDYRAARRNAGYAAAAETLNRDAVLAHCECVNCVSVEAS